MVKEQAKAILSDSSYLFRTARMLEFELSISKQEAIKILSDKSVARLSPLKDKFGDNLYAAAGTSLTFPEWIRSFCDKIVL